MNEELEKKFLEEIKPLIDGYERYVNQETPYSSIIEENKNKLYTNDEEGKILQSIDEELEKLIASKMEELIKARKTKIQEKREEIHTKTQEFVDKSREEVNKEIEEKNKQIQEKEEEIKEYSKKILAIKDKIKKLQDGKVTFKDVDARVYKAMNRAEREKVKELKEESEAYSKMLNDYNGMKEELGQLEEKRDIFDETYGKINFTGENVIDDLKNIIKLNEAKEYFNKIEENYEDILPQMYLEHKKFCIEQYEQGKYDVELPLDVISDCEERIELYEMSENLYPHSDEERKAFEELKEKLELIKERKKIIDKGTRDLARYNKRKEEVIKYLENIEKEYGTDLLPSIFFKDKLTSIEQYANGKNINLNDFNFLKYCEEQLSYFENILRENQKLEKEEIEDFVDLRYKIEDIRKRAKELEQQQPQRQPQQQQQQQPQRQPQQQQQPQRQPQQQPQRQPQQHQQPQRQPQQQQQPQQPLAYMQEVKEKLENLYKKSEEGYEDLLPSLYYDAKSATIRDYMKHFKSNPDDAKRFFERYKKENVLTECREIEEIFERFGFYPKINDEKATDEEIDELRNAIKAIEKRKNIKENAYKETKIVVEPYNDRIMIYLKGEVEPRKREKLAELMKDGENLFKSGRPLKGLLKGIEKGNYAIIAALSELEIKKEEDYIEGYTHMFSKNPKVASNIDSIVYDFTNESGKIQSQKMIKQMQKCAKDAEKYGVAESIGRKKGIIEKGKEGIGNIFGKGKEKVLALGEGIKNFHPIGNAIEKKKAKRYYTDQKVDNDKASNTFREWREKIGVDMDLEVQAENAKIFNNIEKEDKIKSQYRKEEDKFYDRW